MIIGLVGAAGSGKDTVAARLVPEHLVTMGGVRVDIRKRLNKSTPRPFLPNGVQIALADPMKVFLLSLFDFTIEQLWGDSHLRNAPDKRYPRLHAFHETREFDYDIGFLTKPVCTRCGEECSTHYSSRIRHKQWIGPCTDYLTPREALQTLGTEWGRARYRDLWIINTLREAHFLSKTHSDVVISDVRHINEMEAIKREGGVLVWVRRAEQDSKFALHESETESNSQGAQKALETAIILENTGSVEDLRERMRDLIVQLKSRSRVRLGEGITDER